ncbi:hypothetical protein PV326_010522 [Microctonus aethiopoides]|nr:hypothetical protein PV326_010522 [Microctonus aethiopoides]
MTSNSLEDSDLYYIDLKSNDPIDLYTEWYSEAKKFSKGFTNVICLSTVSSDCCPRSRHVFLQSYDENGFVFFTDSRGRKAQELAANNHGSACVYWIFTNDKCEDIMKQVRIEGTIEYLPRNEVEKVYNAQSLYAKIRAHLCHQDTVVNWDELKKRHDVLLEQAKIDYSFLQMPDHFIGCRLIPTWMDFYASKNKCIADRMEFDKSEDGINWIHRRLAA